MVALDVKDVEHLFAVGKAGRIHDDQVKFFAFVCGILQVLEHIGADDFVLFGVDAVEFEIAFCPLEICVGQIDGFAGYRAAGCGIDGEAACVGKQVEEAFARCGFADFFARVAVVEEKAGIEVFVEVDPNLRPFSVMTKSSPVLPVFSYCCKPF